MPTARVEALYTAREDSAPMVEHDRVRLVEGGVEGDRYLTGRGYYSPFDVCEVTVVAVEALEAIRDEFDIDLTDGRHRRNVVVRGADLEALLGATFRLGDADAGAVLRGTRPRPPCAHVEEVADEAGVASALRGRRGGICADVVAPGAVVVDDGVAVLEDDARSEGQKIADRLRGSTAE
ncbi:MOSC domain-containing protein [Halobaculum halobium]|uniref:MOSC domain-containing protein n=1 Tax=Halobaculum halobium TaxID=3032281 RepID=A0ABD5TED1_9EURY|nr:MOSC domain-containing protein [Halobaculum sp. SYNS20]